MRATPERRSMAARDRVARARPTRRPALRWGYRSARRCLAAKLRLPAIAWDIHARAVPTRRPRFVRQNPVVRGPPTGAARERSPRVRAYRRPPPARRSQVVLGAWRSAPARPSCAATLPASRIVRRSRAATGATSRMPAKAGSPAAPTTAPAPSASPSVDVPGKPAPGPVLAPLPRIARATRRAPPVRRQNARGPARRRAREQRIRAIAPGPARRARPLDARGGLTMRLAPAR